MENSNLANQLDGQPVGQLDGHLDAQLPTAEELMALINLLGKLTATGGATELAELNAYVGTTTGGASGTTSEEDKRLRMLRFALLLYAKKARALTATEAAAYLAQLESEPASKLYEGFLQLKQLLKGTSADTSVLPKEKTTANSLGLKFLNGQLTSTEDF